MQAGDSGAEKGISKFERAAKDRKNASLVWEIFGFLRKNKKWWLLPILITFLGIGILAGLSSTAAAPFIYTLF